MMRFVRRLGAIFLKPSPAAPMRRVRHILVALSIALFFPLSPAISFSEEAKPEQIISAGEFHAGVRFVHGKMVELSPDPYQVFSKEEIDAEVERLLARETPISEGEAFIALSKLIGMMRDGHSWVFLDRDTTLFSRSVPLRFKSFSDGLFVRAAEPGLSDLVGAKVLAINGVPIDRAWPRILDAVGGGGQIAVGRAHVYTQMPDFLRAAGIGDSNDEIAFSFLMPGGGQEDRILQAEQHEGYDSLWTASQGLATPAGWAEPPRARQAAWFRHHDKAFWYEYQPHRRAVYAQFNMATVDPDNPWNPSEDRFRPMLKEIFERVEQPDVDRLIIDLRSNHGGNSSLWQPLLHGIIRTEKLYEPGRLFVVIGAETESAAVAWAVKIEGNTRGVFVGQHTASPPNFFNDPAGPRRARFDVPGTALNFFMSNKVEHWSGSNDHRRAIYPDIPVAMSWSDFASGHDPVMDAIMAVTPEQADSFFVDTDGDPIPPTALWANYLRRSQSEAEMTEAGRNR